MAGLYLHIPFCESKCPYCAFTSLPGASPELMERYVTALREDIQRIADERDAPWNTLYIGGGTPTSMTSKLLDVLLLSICNIGCISSTAEVTIEANPGSLNRENLAVALAGGVNRISIGVQSFNDRILRILGRPHDGRTAGEAVDLARRAGVENISLDLMFGVPGQTIGDWEGDLRLAMAMGPEHISLYGLTIEDGTPFDRFVRSGALNLPDDGIAVTMYRRARDLLAEGGWEHYEISSWARPGRACRHNLDCWRLEAFDGAGAAAHGFRLHPSPLRYGNVDDVEDYIRLVAQGKKPRVFEERIDARTLAAEGLMLGLRTTAGIDTAAFARDFGASPERLFTEALNLGRAKGWFFEDGERLCFTVEGLLFSDETFQLLF